MCIPLVRLRRVTPPVWEKWPSVSGSRPETPLCLMIISVSWGVIPTFRKDLLTGYSGGALSPMRYPTPPVFNCITGRGGWKFRYCGPRGGRGGRWYRATLSMVIWVVVTRAGVGGWSATYQYHPHILIHDYMKRGVSVIILLWIPLLTGF